MNIKSYRDLAYLPTQAIDPGITIIKEPTSAARRSWEVYFSSDNNGNPALQVYPGTIAGVLPSNILDPFTYSKNKTNYVIAEIKGNKNGVASCTLSVNSRPPAPTKAEENAPPSTFELVVGLAKDDSVFSIFSGVGSIPLRVQEVFRQQIKVSDFFEVPFKSFYNWVI